MLIIFHSPALQDDARFGQSAKELTVQAFITQLVVEALDVAIFPWTARPDGESLICRSSKKSKMA
jgi:hypothetical protein